MSKEAFNFLNDAITVNIGKVISKFVIIAKKKENESQRKNG